MPFQDTGPATEAVKQYAAERAADDPVKLERAIRIIRAAIARGLLNLTELSNGGAGRAN